jgi:hypothetical protein
MNIYKEKGYKIKITNPEAKKRVENEFHMLGKTIDINDYDVEVEMLKTNNPMICRAITTITKKRK